RIKAGFREGTKLKLPITVSEKRKHIKGQPVWRRLVECAEDTRIISVTGSPGEQRLGFLAAIASEVAVQQVHHGPQVAPLFDVYLKNVSQVVHRGTTCPQHPLLFHGSRFRITLRNDHTA